MTEKHETTPETLINFSKKEGVDPTDIPTNTQGIEMPNKKSQVECQRISCLKSSARYFNLKNSKLVSRKRVSFNEDIQVITVKSYKSYNRPEYMYTESKCCGNRCIIF